MLHRKQLRIEPAMLDIGDYVLSPEICVERKSLLDLIGSITSGRLFTQLTQMARHYPRPMLLIEFEEGKPFALRGLHVKTYQIKELMEKLMLTILHFPKVAIIWSPTPLDTALIFSSLKENWDDPSIRDALEHEAGSTDLQKQYNSQQVDLLLTLPGIDTKNVHRLLNNFNNFAEICTKTESELTRILHSEQNGKKVFKFLHHSHKNACFEQKRKQKVGAYQQYKNAKHKK